MQLNISTDTTILAQYKRVVNWSPVFLLWLRFITRETETVVKSGAKIHVTTNDQSGEKKEDGKHLDKNRKKHQKTN